MSEDLEETLEEMKAELEKAQSQIALMLQGACPECVMSSGPGTCGWCKFTMEEFDKYAEAK